MSSRIPSAPKCASELTLATFARNPCPVYAELRTRDPVAWVPALNMYLVTRYADVRATVLNADEFVVARAERSPLLRVAGDAAQESMRAYLNWSMAFR